MKKLLTLFLIGLITVSCNKNEFTFDRNVSYENSFNKEFGTPSSTHDWGFKVSSSTRAVDVNGNLWYQKWERPINITDAEKAKVEAAFANPIKEKNKINLDYKDFWVQQVSMSHTEHTDSAGNKFDASNCMNQLRVNGEHVNNFNNGANTTVYTDDKTHEKFIGTTLMYNTKSIKFEYHNTKDSRFHDEYIILEVDGSYYVGFDFWAYRQQPANANQGVARDYIYNDWIVKITPAIPYTPQAKDYDGAKRIIVEDLLVNIENGINPSDWDFNDVVFDVATAWINNANRTIVTILAAGGTIPLTIEGKEVHQLFGVNVSDMVNTGAGPNKKPVTIYLDKVYWKHEFNTIPVIANGIELKADIGKAPQKIAVGTDYQWCSERQNIKSRYPKFVDYVKNNGDNSWYN